MNRDRYILTNAEKEPVDPITGTLINPHDPLAWMPRDVAVSAAAALGLEVAYVLAEDDPTAVIDIDKCRDPITGTYDERALRIHAAMPGAAVELSRSGTGLHFWFTCEQGLDRQYKNRADGIEFYQSGRYIILGSDMRGDPTIDMTDALRTILTPRDTADATVLPGSGPVPEYTGPDDDLSLIAMMMQARGSIAAMFGNAAPLPALWKGDAEVLSRFYPSETDDFDRSVADAALCAHLAFWTGKDVARIERLWLMSPLVAQRRDRRKLDRPDYRSMTVRGAAEKCKTVYSVSSPVHVDPVAGEFLTTHDQVKHFEGCIYVAEEHAVLVPDGSMLKPDPFKVLYGGHEFQMQADGARPTRDAFEAFTQNRSHQFPRAKRRRYWPDKPFGWISPDEEVNVFRLPRIVTSDADVTPFLDLVGKLLPDPDDRAILLSWMAAAVQRRGVKFQWAVVLQGTEGNGKTFLLKCLEYAIGQSVSHLPNPEDMGEKFNSFIEGNLFIGVEEIHMSGRREMLDRLKKYITNDRIEIRGMRQEKRMTDNLTNWMFLTNYRDAVLKSRNDRRYAIFFTAQQDAPDLARDGMTGDYFPSLWSWARNGGYAAVAGFLGRYEIPAHLNPAEGCHRAPRTSSADAAVEESMGPIEQDIMEAVENELPGFRGGWISSYRAREYLTAMGRKNVSNNVLRTAILNLGYVVCPLWDKGRANPIRAEMGLRPVLYCTKEVATTATSLEDYIIMQNYEPPGKNIVIIHDTRQKPN